jgi:hypothetical protein
VVEEGSNRKRDLAGYRRMELAKAHERLDGARAGSTAMAAWNETARRLHVALPDSTFAIWLAPIRLVGAEGTTLFLTAPEQSRPWIERRYSQLIREALQGTGYSEVEFVASEETAS